MPVRLLHSRFAAFRVFRPRLFALRPLCSLFLPIGSRTKGTFSARQTRPFRRETSSRLVVFSLSRLAPPIPRVCVAHVPPASRPADTNAPLAGRGHQACTKPTPSLHQACPKPMRRLRGADSKPAPRLPPTYAPHVSRKAAKCALRARGACPECAPLAGRARPARTSSGRTKETSPLWATPLPGPPDHCRRTSGSCTQVPR